MSVTAEARGPQGEQSFGVQGGTGQCEEGE